MVYSFSVDAAWQHNIKAATCFWRDICQAFSGNTLRLRERITNLKIPREMKKDTQCISITYLSVCACVLVHRRVGVCMHLRACSLVYPACNAYVPCCDVMWPLWLHQIFRHYVINGAIFLKKLLNIKCVFWFSLQLLSKTFLILSRIERDIVINVKTPSCKVPVILVGF